MQIPGFCFLVHERHGAEKYLLPKQNSRGQRCSYYILICCAFGHIKYA